MTFDYWTWWFTLTLSGSSSYVKVIGHSSRSQEKMSGWGGFFSITEFCQVQNSFYVPSLAMSYIGSVTAWHSSSRHLPNFAGMELRNFRKQCHLYSAGLPSCWASAHILVWTEFNWTRTNMRQNMWILNQTKPCERTQPIYAIIQVRQHPC